eukprot:CAMPEP_0173134596 /NCGR_PEP_ID=MMETSP1105-20130129/1387_1 /TAXON_ID=2985 /ORGANISM="Ochromonas sp., Strain BG-1" /LENGTH=1267 /DNA_ID=CAMNT_0014046427 /DNA_START=161 /DNA_END=3965 /DNA_ORIENTATION=-
MQNTRGHPAIFDTADKRLRFGVSDSGEFIDSVYREQESNKLFSKMIGRHYIPPHSKPLYTAADIVCEGYLYKKGSWMKNWKRRYFVLRKDIRSLCYYASREDLTLLGSIPLDIDTKLANVKPDDADGHQNVVAIETDFEDGTSMKTYIRFETFEKMKAWMLDIKNEAQNMTFTDEDQLDWWNALFAEVQTIEPKNAPRRDGLTGDADHDDAPAKRDEVKPAVNNSALAGSVAPLFVQVPATDFKGYTENEGFSDDDSDDETSPKPSSTGKSSESESKRKSQTSGIPQNVSNPTNTTNSKYIKKIKHLKPEKPAGPPPFDHVTAERYETSQGALAGLQISLVCTYQDRIFVVIFGSASNSLTADGPPSLLTTTSSVPGQTPTREKRLTNNNILNTLTGGSNRWVQICRTEVRTITERPAYSESYLSEVKLYFNVLENLIPENCKDIKIVVFRQENEKQESKKVEDLNQQLEIADFKSVLKIKMKVRVQLPVDIAVPIYKDSEVILGIVKLTSYFINQHRQWLNKSMKISPYSEILYSFGTSSGMTLSLEQLYACRYSTSVAQSLLQLWSAERNDYLIEKTRQMKEDFAVSFRDYEPKLRATLSPNENLEDKITQYFEPFQKAIETVEDLWKEMNEISSIILNAYDNFTQGKEVKNNVIPVEQGGNILRRSTWKKITIFQYCTTNLNLHLLISKYFSFQEIHNNGDYDGSSRNMHYVPTITLGCPAAHELKFSDGGLRKIFIELPSFEQKLVWIHALQYPTMEFIDKLMAEFPKESMIIFGNKCAMNSKEEYANLLKRKIEISRRIDIVASQALGCAVQVVRTICMLATIAQGNYFDILARSLKIGFVVMFESMLSTQGAELGMIEDLEIATLWLSLVSVRLVTVQPGKKDSGHIVGDSPSVQTQRKHVSVDGKPVFYGTGDGVTVRRDTTGRFVVDIEISSQEAAVVLDALNYMSGFDQRSTKVISAKPHIPFAFAPNPHVVYATDETAPRVYATVELFGIAFTQGVNEMQTLANLSSSRDVLKQVEINQASLTRLNEFYRSYRDSLDFQLTRRAPEMIEALNAMVPATNSATGSSSSFSNPSGQSIIGTVNTGPGSLQPQKSFIRRKSVRQSLNTSHFGSSPSSEAVSQAVIQLKIKVLSFSDRLLDQLQEAVVVAQSNPYDKHVDILLKSSSLIRQMAGVVCILCKSGKDRTSMGVTLEHTRSLVEDLGVLNGQEVCQLMRAQGVRRMNVYANTGQPMFAFNQIQRRALPSCYRPPPGSHAGNITS